MTNEIINPPTIAEAIFFDPHFFHDARRHGEGGNARRADHRVDLFFAEEIHQFRAHYAADRIEDECEKPQPHDHQRFPGDELFRLHLERDRNAEKKRNDIR